MTNQFVKDVIYALLIVFFGMIIGHVLDGDKQTKVQTQEQTNGTYLSGNI